MGLPPAPSHTITQFEAPPKREAGKKVEDVAALVEALKERGLA
jgi:hypothetical protein